MLKPPRKKVVLDAENNTVTFKATRLKDTAEQIGLAELKMLIAGCSFSWEVLAAGAGEVTVGSLLDS